jgi:ATP-binding protein involved in chromosome partitioning
MFDKVSVPLLGVIENMSYLEAPDGSRQNIFGEGGGQKTAESLEVDLLGQVPLDTNIRAGGDQGIPIVISDPDSKAAQVFDRMARQILERLKKHN